ncbi:MAG: abortive infection system antitoxin AbiGi family protein [Melioribacteraceae bacterium]
MKLSANSLYHFTPKYDNIKSILENGFLFSALKEDIPFSMYANSPFSIQGIINYINISKAVCFCDIPLNLCNEHATQYGKYVIGLSKEWGIKKGITPIRYIHYSSPDINNDSYRSMRNSYMMYQQHNNSPYDFYRNIIEDLYNIEPQSEDEIGNIPVAVKKTIIYMNSQLIDMAKYVMFAQNFLRSYEGDWVDRITKEITKRRYYDEREWRAVKNADETGNLLMNPEDITDIIVNTPEERKDIYSFMCDILKNGNKKVIESKITMWEDITSL